MKRGRQGKSSERTVERKQNFAFGSPEAKQAGKATTPLPKIDFHQTAAARHSISKPNAHQQRPSISSLQPSSTQAPMHLAGSTVAAGARIATRSRTRQLEEGSHVLALTAATAPAAADATFHASSLVPISSDLKAVSVSSQHQTALSHHAALLPASTKRTAAQACKQNQSTAAAVTATPIPGRLQHRSSDDLQQILDAAGASSTSMLVHPSLLRHSGVTNQHSPIRAASHPVHREALSTAAAPLMLPVVAQHAAHVVRHHPLSNNGRTDSSKHSSLTRPAPPSVLSKRSISTARRVSFAPGPLSEETAKIAVSDDGHPATEGALATPVRRLPQSYPTDLTRGNILMLENLLGSGCSMSVARLKRRVGLLPPIRPPRPHASCRPAGRGEPFNGEEEAAAAAAPTTAVSSASIV